MYNLLLMTLSTDIKQKAIQLGFCSVGITTAEPIASEQIEYLADWLNAGRAGQTQYMYKNFEKRINPAKLLKNAQSVICVALAYKPKIKIACPDTAGPMGLVANYAIYEDYHRFIKNQLYELTGFISSQTNKNFRFKICVDSVPLAERALAQRAGVGFIGKNHMLINPKFGPQILLGEIITDLKLQIDKPIKSDCADCDNCIKACPAGALTKDGRFDANKCISYLTIEHKGQIPAELTAKIGNRLFGCQECILACPYEKNAPATDNENFRFYPERKHLNLKEIMNRNGAKFEQQFADSPILRLGLEKLKRNAQICLNNIGKAIN